MLLGVIRYGRLLILARARHAGHRHLPATSSRSTAKSGHRCAQARRGPCEAIRLPAPPARDPDWSSVAVRPAALRYAHGPEVPVTPCVPVSTPSVFRS